MNAPKFVRQLGCAVQLPELALDKNNVCRVVVDGHSMDFEQVPGEDTLFLIAEVLPLPLSENEALFRMLLEGNRLGLHTGDAVFSMDADRGEILLHRKLDTGRMDYAAFEAAVNVFFASLKHWKNMCAGGAAAADAPGHALGHAADGAAGDGAGDAAQPVTEGMLRA